MELEPWGEAAPEDVEAAVRDGARLRAVHQVAASLGDSDGSFDRITRLLARLVDAPMAAFSLVEEDRQLISAAFGLAATETSAEEGIFCRTCVARGDLLVVPDAALDPRFADSPLVAAPPHLRFYAGLPVRSPAGPAVGTLCVADARPRELSLEQEQVLRDLRESLEEVLLLRTLSVNDSLTGLYNRGYFDDLLVREERRCGRDSEPLALLMADVDHFKAYNDRYGHQAGDACLKAIAATLRATCGRGGDVPARYGGEEFAVILPDTDAEAAEGLAERFQEHLGGVAITHADSPHGVVTVSIGIAVARPLPGEEGAPDALVTAADAALYEAKDRGRATIVVRDTTDDPV